MQQEWGKLVGRTAVIAALRALPPQRRLLCGFRAWWRRTFHTRIPSRCLPSINWAHTRHCIGGVSYSQAIDEQTAWTRNTRARWLAGERM